MTPERLSPASGEANQRKSAKCQIFFFDHSPGSFLSSSGHWNCSKLIRLPLWSTLGSLRACMPGWRALQGPSCWLESWSNWRRNWLKISFWAKVQSLFVSIPISTQHYDETCLGKALCQPDIYLSHTNWVITRKHENPAHSLQKTPKQIVRSWYRGEKWGRPERPRRSNTKVYCSDDVFDCTETSHDRSEVSFSELVRARKKILTKYETNLHLPRKSKSKVQRTPKYFCLT